MTHRNRLMLSHFCYSSLIDTTIVPMRHLFALPILCAMLAGCATPMPPVLGSFTLEPGQHLAVAPGTNLHFDAVDDSRCPPNVHCIWAGKLSYRFSLQRGGKEVEAFELSPWQPEARPAALGGRRILLDASAIPAPPAAGMRASYRASFNIHPA
jgi:hypothetical protein